MKSHPFGRKILSLMLAILMTVGMMPMVALATDTTAAEETVVQEEETVSEPATEEAEGNGETEDSAPETADQESQEQEADASAGADEIATAEEEPEEEPVADDETTAEIEPEEQSISVASVDAGISTASTDSGSIDLTPTKNVTTQGDTSIKFIQYDPEYYGTDNCIDKDGNAHYNVWMSNNISGTTSTSAVKGKYSYLELTFTTPEEGTTSISFSYSNYCNTNTNTQTNLTFVGGSTNETLMKSTVTSTTADNTSKINTTSTIAYKAFSDDTWAKMAWKTYSNNELEPGTTYTITMWYYQRNTNVYGYSRAFLADLVVTNTLDGINVSAVAVDSNYGTVTVGSGDTGATSSERIQSGTVDLVAEATEDGQFYGWIDENGHYLTSETTYTYTATADTTLTARFAKAGTYVARIDGTFYETLPEALAASESGDTVILLKDVTLSEDATVPSGVTLLLPISSTDETGYVEGASGSGTTRMAWVYESAYLYETLTVDSGCTLTVNGILTVGGTQHYPSQAGAQGHTSGAYSQIINNGAIDVNGTLYVYGLIKGGGAVNLISGSRGYIPFLLIDYSGGTDLVTLYSNGTFPIGQYATNNIQCTMVMEGGAYLVGMSSVFTGTSTITTQNITVISPSSNALIQLPTGSTLTATYDADQCINTTVGNINLSDFGKTTWTISGGATIGGMSLSYAGVTASSSGFALNIPYTFDFVLQNGTYTMQYSYRIMPGANLTVAEDATLNVNGSLQVMDGWSQSALHNKQYPTSATLSTYGFSQSGNLYVNGTLNIASGASFGGVVQTNNENAKLTVASDATVALIDQADGTGTDKAVTYDLYGRIRTKNGELTTLAAGKSYAVYDTEKWSLTSYNMGETTTEISSAMVGSWQCADGDHTYEGVVTREATCTEDGVMTYTCSDCGDSYTVAIPAAHCYEAVVTEPTYTTKGYTTYTCTVCGDSYVVDETDYLSGWVTTENGAQYYEGGSFKTGLTAIDDELYYFDENGYAVSGLVRIVKDDGEVNYYYFRAEGDDEVNTGKNFSGAAYTAVKNVPESGANYWITKTNDLLPEWGYYFDENGVILHDEDTSINGIHEDDGALYYYIDGIKVHYGLFMSDGDYYYAKSNGALVVNQAYWITRTNGLMEEGSYTFDEEGKMVLPDTSKNGIVSENGSLYYYVDGVLTYAGLIEIDGSYYYVRTSGEVVHGCTYWITKTNGLMEEGSYTFDDDGKLVLPDTSKNGIVSENDSLYYYVDGVLTYAGLIEINDSYYYVRTSGEVVHGCTYWITKTNGLMEEGSYTFEEDGKMVLPDTSKNGIVSENGSLYYYVDGALTYAGLIEIDGNYYYVKSTGEVIHGRTYWITKTNGLMAEGSYTFDDDGKMAVS